MNSTSESSLRVPLVSVAPEGPEGPGAQNGRGYSADFEDLGPPPDDDNLSLPSHDGLEGPQQRSKRFLSALKGMFQGGSDLEGAGVNHQYTREERARLSDVESIEYLPPNSAVYRRWLAAQPHGMVWDRWFMMGSIGVVVAILGFMLFSVIDLCARFKLHTVRWLLMHTNIGLAWLFNMLFSLALVGVSTWTVVEVAPQAAGAGVAEVTAYLNGCMLPKCFNIHTLIVKFISCAAAVGSGLPVGPEGPMVHIGAMVGGALSQGHSTTLGFSTGLFERFRNPKDKRDFMTAGTAVGIATAFGAPIGGLLFAMEEVASSFNQALGSQIFFACMLAVLTLDTARSAQRSLFSGHFGSFDGEASNIFFEVQTQLANHVAAMAPAALIGVACGCLAILFTVINIKVARARALMLQGNKMGRMAEPCILMALFVTLGMLLPLLFPCTPTQCVVAPQGGHPVCAPGVSDHVKRVVEQSLELYTCSGKASDDSEMPSLETNTTSFQNYNELATLMSVTGEEAIKHLLSRGTHREFGYAALLVMLVYYFTGAVWAAGTAIASGLFVPMLMIGSCVGRIVGLIAVDIAAHGGYGSPEAPPGVFVPPSPWAWIDPGAFALIGAGAFMGGVTRLTISLAVIMMEVSNDVRMLLPLLVGILVAKWVADAATHPLYHALLQVKCVPWLPSEAGACRPLDLVPTSAAMTAPVVTATERMRLDTIRSLLRDTRHNGFPVVRDTPAGQVCVGLVVRDHLMVLLRRGLARGAAPALPDLSYEELNRQFVSAAARTMVSEQQMAVLQGRTAHGVPPGGTAAFEQVLDLTPYINNSAPVVNENFSLQRTYMLFRTLGLRHLTVMDAHGHVKGIITRKDLLGFRLDEAVERSRLNGTYAAGPLRQRSSTESLAPEGGSYA